METKASGFKFDGYLVRHCKQDINMEPNGDLNELGINISPSGKRGADKFVLTLDVRVSDKEGRFNLHLVVDGFFRFKDDMDGYELSSYFLTNAPAILFPYVRSYISMISTLSGIGTVNLPTLNLVGLKGELENNIQTME